MSQPEPAAPGPDREPPDREEQTAAIDILKFRKVAETDMSGRKLGSTLSLAQFMQRQDVMKLCRDVFKTIRMVPDPDYQDYLRIHVRERFGYHIKEEDAHEIRVLVSQGRNELKKFQRDMNCEPPVGRQAATNQQSPKPF